MLALEQNNQQRGSRGGTRTTRSAIDVQTTQGADTRGARNRSHLQQQDLCQSRSLRSSDTSRERTSIKRNQTLTRASGRDTATQSPRAAQHDTSQSVQCDSNTDLATYPTRQISEASPFASPADELKNFLKSESKLSEVDIGAADQPYKPTIKVEQVNDPGTADDEGELFNDRRPLIFDYTTDTLYIGGFGQYHEEAMESHGFAENRMMALGGWFPHGSTHGKESIPAGKISWFSSYPKPEWQEAIAEKLGTTPSEPSEDKWTFSHDEPDNHWVEPDRSIVTHDSLPAAADIPEAS